MGQISVENSASSGSDLSGNQQADPEAFVARLGGDEFGILAAGSDDPVAAGTVAERVLRQLAAPFPVGTATFHLGASIGLVLCPGLSHFEAADAALKAALLALQHAETQGSRRHTVFTPQLGRRADERRWLEDELRGAFARDEFELHFQPQVTLPNAQVVGAEALLRWHHPVRGLLSPADFLPVLEASGIAVDVGRWILRSCAFAAGLAAEEFPIRIGVNLFAAQLRNESFFDDVVAALNAAGLPDVLLELEITEITVVVGAHEAILVGRHNVELERAPRDAAYCAHTILGGEPLVIPSTQADPRFSANPLTKAGVGFYAGMPLLSADGGHRLGALCVIDDVARSALDEGQRRLLQGLARLVSQDLERRRAIAASVREREVSPLVARR